MVTSCGCAWHMSFPGEKLPKTVEMSQWSTE
jgi:hypothetical protein